MHREYIVNLRDRIALVVENYGVLNFANHYTANLIT